MSSHRGRKPLGRLLALGFFVSLLGVGACGNTDGLTVTAEAQASCVGEDPTDAMKMAGATMLPGRVCGACHRTGGQAQNSPWTVSGTVFSAKNSACNSGEGLPSIFVEILYGQDDPMGAYRAGAVQPNGRLKTNSVGNFSTAQKFVAPIRARICETTGADCSSATRVQTMTLKVGADPVTGATQRVDCNLCHYANGQALTRIYLP